jgi:hypothetical protein
MPIKEATTDNKPDAAGIVNKPKMQVRMRSD